MRTERTLGAQHDYAVRTCGIGQGEACGEPATHLIAVAVVADNAWADQARLGGIVGLCEYHASTPVAMWSR